MTPATTNRVVLKPNQSFNVNQTPVLFIINTKCTYEESQKNHQENIWISQP